MVATVRDGEVNDRHPLRDLLTGLGTLDRVAEVGLGRLSRQETAALARAAGRPLTASEADRLFAGTEGEALVLGLDELWRRRIVRDRGPDAYDFTHVGFAAGWAPDDPDSERHTAWVRAGWEALRPHGTGVYVNFLSDEGATGLQATYGDRPQRPRRSGTEAEPAR